MGPHPCGNMPNPRAAECGRRLIANGGMQADLGRGLGGGAPGGTADARSGSKVRSGLSRDETSPSYGREFAAAIPQVRVPGPNHASIPFRSTAGGRNTQAERVRPHLLRKWTRNGRRQRQDPESRARLLHSSLL